MVCDEGGQLLAQAFPPMLDAATVERAAKALGERTAALQTALGPVGMIDLRYTGSRIVVKVMGGARVLFLCTPSMNLQLLNMSAAGVLRQIEAGAAVQVSRPPAGGALYQAVQTVEALIKESGGDRVKLRGQIALKAGFTLDLVDADTPDDRAKLQSLRAAARAVLGADI